MKTAIISNKTEPDELSDLLDQIISICNKQSNLIMEMQQVITKLSNAEKSEFEIHE
jgi:hypothetical protein